MRKAAFLAFVIIATTTLHAQQFKAGTYGQTDQFVTDFLRQVKSKDARSVKLGNIKGSPYFNEDFIEGKVIYNNEPQDQVAFLRYNAFSDEIEMTPHQYQFKSDQAIVKNTSISCLIGDEKFIYLPYKDKASEIVKMGYLIEMYKGKQFNVFFNKTKVYMDPVQARTGLERSFPARFVDDETYYYNIDGGTPQELKLYKSKLKEIFDNKERYNSYIRKHKRTKNNTDQWVIDLFNYMDQ